eukprot:1898056-Prymnesium_polylepis.1
MLRLRSFTSCRSPNAPNPVNTVLTSVTVDLWGAFANALLGRVCRRGSFASAPPLAAQRCIFRRARTARVTPSFDLWRWRAAPPPDDCI